VLECVLIIDQASSGVNAVDLLTDIMRLWETSLGAVALGSTPIYLPVVGFSWTILVQPSGREVSEDE
jgi:hypothetical protein